MPPLLLYVLPVFSTALGGLLAVRLRRYLSLVTALGAGLLLGAAFLDLLPEAVLLGPQTGLPASDVLALMLVAFFFFYAVESVLDLAKRRWMAGGAGRQLIGRAGAAMLVFHSFRDGMAIGAAYAVSHPAGYAVALGIAAHDLGDGINMVLLCTSGERPTRTDWGLLGVDALAPCLGVLVTAWWTFSARGSVVLLVVAAGFFLHTATSDFLPELRRSEGSRRYVLPSVLLGAAVIYGANLLVTRHS